MATSGESAFLRGNWKRHMQRTHNLTFFNSMIPYVVVISQSFKCNEKISWVPHVVLADTVEDAVEGRPWQSQRPWRLKTGLRARGSC